MDTRVLMAIIIVGVALGVALLIGIAVWAYRRRRTARLKGRFGPEYDRMLAQKTSRNRAEAELEARVRRVNVLHVHELDPKVRAHFTEAWQSAQARFADDPEGTVAAAERLLREALEARGYPPGGLEQTAADISVHHAHVVEDYRRAGEMMARAEGGAASTEDLRQALMGYRALFEDLVGERVSSHQAHEMRAA
jgi:hypothetical protein